MTEAPSGSGPNTGSTTEFKSDSCCGILSGDAVCDNKSELHKLRICGLMMLVFLVLSSQTYEFSDSICNTTEFKSNSCCGIISGVAVRDIELHELRICGLMLLAILVLSSQACRFSDSISSSSFEVLNVPSLQLFPFVISLQYLVHLNED